MTNKRKTFPSAKAFLSVRVTTEQKDLVDQAAEREGLYISTFIIMLLVRSHVLPDDCLKKIKRRAIPFFNALHSLLRVVNNIGGNCKQLLTALPDTAGVISTHACILRAAAAITDALHGKAIPASVNLPALEAVLTEEGYVFNGIIRSVNMGKPDLTELPATLTAITDTTSTIAASLTGKPVSNVDMAYVKDLAELAMEEMRANMKNAAKEQAARHQGDV